MAGEIDKLKISVEANANTASRHLESLITDLGKLKTALNGIDSSGLQGLANGVSKFASSMQGMQNIKVTDFTRLAKGIQKLGSIDTASINKASSSFALMTKSFAGLGSASKEAESIGNLAKNIAKLGSKSTSTAITNIPQLAKALSELMETLSKAPNVSSGIIKMTNAMANLAQQGAKVKSTTKNVSSGFNEFSRSANNAKESSRSLAYYLGKMYANFFMVIRGAKAFASAIKSSMNYIEEYNYYNVVMQKIASEWSQDWEKYGYDSAESYADSFQSRTSELLGKMTGFSIGTDGTLTDMQSKNLGLDMTSLMNYSAGLSQVTNSLGLTGEASETTSKALTMLAGDMSSFRNLNMSEVMTNFQSGLIGQSRALYKYGIDITNATLANYALQYGISKSVSEMSQSEKMQLRLIAILDQSKVAWGDLANTINSPSNQLRLLKNNFSSLARTIGNIFLPVVAKVLPYINGLVIAIRRLFTWVGSLLGVDLSGIIGNSSAGYNDAFADAADDAEDTSSAIDDVGNSAGTSADKVKELKNELMGFDEMNKLSDNSDSDSTSGKANSGKSGGIGSGGAIDLTDALNASLADYEKVWNEAFEGMQDTADKYADNISDFFKEVATYAEPSVDAVKRLWNEGLKQFGDFQWTNLKNFWKDFLVPLGKWTLGTGFPQFVDILNDSLKNINYGPLASSLDELYQALEPFAEEIGQGLIDFFKDVANLSVNVINAMPKYISNFADAIKKLKPDDVEKLGYALGILLATVTGVKLTTAVMGNIANLGDVIGKLGKINGLEGVAGGLSKFATVAFKFAGYAGIAVIIAGIAVALDKFEIIDVNWNLLGDGLKSIISVLAKVGIDIGKGLINFFKGISPLLKGVTFVATSAVGAGLKLIAEAIELVPDGVWTVVGSGLTGIVTALLLYKSVSAIPAIISKVADSVKLMYTGLYVMMVDNPVGLIAAGLGALIGVIAGISQLGGIEEKSVEVSEGVKAIIDSAKNASDALNQQTTSVSATYGATREFADKYFELADNFDNLTDSQKEMLKTYAKYIVDDIPELAGSINSVTGEFTGQKDEVYKTIDALEEYAKKAAIQEILKDLYVEQVKLKIQIQETSTAYDDAKQKMIDAIKQYSDLSGMSKEQHDREVDEYYSTEDLATVYDGYSDIMYRHGQNTQFSKEQCEQLDADQSSLQGSLDQTNGTIDTATGMLGDLAGGYGGAKDAANGVSDASGEAADNVAQDSSNAETAVKTAAGNSSAAVNNSSTESKGAVSSFFNHTSEKFNALLEVGTQGGSNLTTGLMNGTNPIEGNVTNLMSKLYGVVTSNSNSAGTDGGNALTNSMGTQLSSLPGIGSSAVSGMSEDINSAAAGIGDGTGETIGDHIADGISNKKTGILGILGDLFSNFSVDFGFDSGIGGLITMGVKNIFGFASGGFPDQGQFFLARENGPEMVGTMGGKTAVANNDQITNGIANAVAPAVYNAVVSAMSKTNSNNGGGFNGNIYIGGKQVTDVIIEDINGRTDIQGFSPLKI